MVPVGPLRPVAVTAGGSGPGRAPPLPGTIRQRTGRAAVSQWLAGDEAAWRAPGTAALAGIFTGDAPCLHSPCEQSIAGLDAIRRMWQRTATAPMRYPPSPPAFWPSMAPLPLCGLRVRYGDPAARSTKTCGSWNGVMTAVASGSRSGLAGLGAPTVPAATRPQAKVRRRNSRDQHRGRQPPPRRRPRGVRERCGRCCCDLFPGAQGVRSLVMRDACGPSPCRRRSERR